MADSALDETEVGDTEACPCGSGRSYRDCCKSGFGRLIRLSNGRIVDQRPLSEDAVKVLKEAELKFYDVFGRKPQKGDRVFLAAHLDVESDILDLSNRALGDESVRPELLYAYRETGLLPTEATFPLMSARDREEWEEAINDFEDLASNDIDPFTGLKASVRDLLECLDQFCEDCAIHMASYVDRYRKNRKLDIHEFSQILVISRSQKILLLLRGKLGPSPKADALILVRSLLECYLVHQYLQSGRNAGLYFLSRAHERRDGLFSYKMNANGRPDKRTIVFSDTGEEMPSYVSFYKMAKNVK
ncbi:MAG: SEC-C domain-containing protein [Sphingopyxis sp.]|uniref:SEC-C domain-containing protein n=1 Tax=Sphingopyxis sp. TaxID=1908224 RepID=UPI001A42F864|nr:SEC-C domain-containing protein [Sphingopyxis sp.]MBL9065388.1 SEC-C domain-containing protein [Sphingopyxis sp.]